MPGKRISGEKRKGIFRAADYASELRPYTVLILFPLALAILLLVMVHRISTAQLEEKGEVTAQRFSQQVTGILDEIELLSDSLTVDPGFMSRVASTTFNEVDMKVICDAITSHLRSPYISKAFFVADRHDYIYSQNVYVMAGMPGIMSGILGENAEDLTEDAIDLSEEGWHLLKYRNTYPYYVKKIIGRDGSQLGTLFVTLDTSRFIRAVHQTNRDVDFFCLYDGEASLTSLLTAQPPIDWKSDRAVSELLGYRVRSFTVEENGFSYMVAVSLKSYYYPLYTIIALFAVYFLSVLVVGTWHAVRASRKRYESIASLMEGLPQEGASTSELLGSVRKSLESYRDMSESYDALLRVRRLRQFMTGDAAEEADEETLRSLGLTGARGGYAAAEFTVFNSDIDGPHKIAIEVTTLILQSLLNELGGERMTASVTDMAHAYWAVLCLDKSFYESEELRELLAEVVRVCLESYGIELRISVSGFGTAFGRMERAVNEARDISVYADTSGSTASVILARDMRDAMGLVVSGDFLKETQILANTLVMGRYDMIPSIVSAIVADHIPGKTGSAALMRYRLTTLGNTLSEAVFSAGIPREDALAYAHALRDAETPADLLEAVNRIFPDALRIPISDAANETLSRVRAYIEAHISDPALSVAEVAEENGVSVQQLNRLFRQQMDTTTLEFINRSRIEEAKRALTETDEAVITIAERVGFQSKTTFLRNFQRYTGVTPSEYRTASRKRGE